MTSFPAAVLGGTPDDFEETEMDMTPTPAEVLAKLDALGSADQIADFLTEQGVTGRRAAITRCPIAEYVSAQAAHLGAVGERGWHSNTGCGDVPLPGNVAGFVARFDSGAYPALVRVPS